jgi:predicted amidohydrolase
MDKTTVKVACVQLNAKQCFSEHSFYAYIEKVFEQSEADILIFPEDISFCLAWVKEESIRIQSIGKQSIKSSLENLSSFILSRLNLKKMGKWICEPKIERIIRNTFESLTKKYKKVAVAGSIYVQRSSGKYNSSLVFDNGKFVGEYLKQNLVPLEIAWGIKGDYNSTPIQTSKGIIGVCICYDLNDPNVCMNLKKKGADFIVAPSSGWRPYPWYPFDRKTECPQIYRALENDIEIFRPYFCGFLFPGLFFQGHSMIVGRYGEIIKESTSIFKQEILSWNVVLNSRN